jgi:tetratricopeptide (TPR) repeat protein
MAARRLPLASAEFEQARQLDPLSAVSNWHVAWGSYVAGNYDEAIERYQKALDLHPEYVRAMIWMGLAYEREGMKGKAKKLYERAGGPANKAAMALLGRLAAAEGNRKEALTVIHKLVASPSEADPTPHVWIASIYTALGDKDQAFAALEMAYQQRNSFVTVLLDPEFEILRSDPRFADLVHRIGIP